MSTRERILLIRLLEKVAAHPIYAAVLGIEVNTKDSPPVRNDTHEGDPL